MKRRAFGLLLLPLPGWAQTERKGSRPIYRCGNTLSDRPCSADAAASSVRFDEPSRADAQAARQRAAQDAREAERLQREREAQQAQRGSAAGRLDAPRPAETPASGAASKPGKKARQARVPKKSSRAP